MSVTMPSDHNIIPASTVALSPPLSSTPTRFVMNSSAAAPVSAITTKMQQMRIAVENIFVESIAEKLSADEVATIFSFLLYSDIMRARVCTTWRDNAKKTLVPLSEMVVHNVGSYNAMRVMSTALPNLQQLSICDLSEERHKYIEGEEPDESRAARTANWNSHDINVIFRFRKLRALYIGTAPLNGRYPVLFNYPLLKKLTIKDCRNLKCDLGMIASLPSLKELLLWFNPHLAGNLISLRALKDCLESVVITGSPAIEGNFMDLADFPRLRCLDLQYTNLTGDIRNIREDDFPALESRLLLPREVVGGMEYKFQLISDVPELIHAARLLLHRSRTLLLREFQEWHAEVLSEVFSEVFTGTFFWSLSSESPDWYGWEDEEDEDDAQHPHPPPPPFRLQFMLVGSRLGWSWISEDGQSFCEINWLDPEPSSESCDYESYDRELQRLRQQKIQFYRGYYQPPNEHQYHRMCEEFVLRLR